MLKLIIASTLLAAAPVIAVAAPTPDRLGNPVGTTRYPPAPHHSDLGPQPLNSLPPAATTHSQHNPGSTIATGPGAPKKHLGHTGTTVR